MSKLGVIIPYRDRPQQLSVFIPHIRKFLQKKGIYDYEIIVVEQEEGVEFNRGLLLNVGFLEAERLDCDYVAFHDLDMLPLEADYSYSDRVVQLAQEFEPEQKIPYDYFGGVSIFPVELFRDINGYSNEYWGWGFEDNDLLLRCQERNLTLSKKVLSQPKTSGTCLEFAGNSYLKFPNLFSFKNSTLIFVDFEIEKLPVDLKNGHDEASIFAIPGLDLTLSYDSFGTYKFECFDNYEDVYSMHTDNLPKMHCQAVIYYDHLTKTLKFFLNGNFVGGKTLLEGRRIKIGSGDFYLGAAEDTGFYVRKPFIGKILTFIGVDKCSEELLTEVLDRGFVDILPEDTKLWLDFTQIQNLNGVQDSSGHLEPDQINIVNCKVGRVPVQSKLIIPVPEIRKGTYRLQAHETNGSEQGYWKNWSTRLNQKRFERVKQEGTSKDREGLRTVGRVSKREVIQEEGFIRVKVKVKKNATHTHTRI